MIVLLPEVYENADKMEQLMDRQALLQDKIDALGWEIVQTRNCNGCFANSGRYSNQEFILGNAVV
jgi:hypothetical protein